jgi:hypothetical protein
LVGSMFVRNVVSMIRSVNDFFTACSTNHRGPLVEPLITSVTAEIRTKHLPNTSVQRYPQDVR